MKKEYEGKLPYPSDKLNNSDLFKELKAKQTDNESNFSGDLSKYPLNEGVAAKNAEKCKDMFLV